MGGRAWRSRWGCILTLAAPRKRLGSCDVADSPCDCTVSAQFPLSATCVVATLTGETSLRPSGTQERVETEKSGWKGYPLGRLQCRAVILVLIIDTKRV